MLTVSRMPRLFLVPTTLNRPNTLVSLINEVTFAIVRAASYASSLSTRLILYFLPATVTPPWSLMYWKYDFSPWRMALNGAYVPDCATLVPIVIVSAADPGGLAALRAVRRVDNVAPPDELLPDELLVVLFVPVLRLLPHAAATTASTVHNARTRSPRDAARRSRRAWFMGRVPFTLSVVQESEAAHPSGCS